MSSVILLSVTTQRPRGFGPVNLSKCFLRTNFGSSHALTLTPRNPKGMNSFQIFAAGWSSLVARKAHNLEVPGSNPGPATKTKGGLRDPFFYPGFRSGKVTL